MDGTVWRYQYKHFAPTYCMVLIDSPRWRWRQEISATADLDARQVFL